VIRRFVLASGVVVMAVVLSAWYIVQSSQTAADVDEITELLREINVHHKLPQSVSLPHKTAAFGRIAVRGALLRRYNVISVYGVNSTQEQDRIVSTLSKYRASHSVKPIEVCFYENEVWERRGSSGRRGQETVVRTVRVD
jgi:hypothetical protein